MDLQVVHINFWEEKVQPWHSIEALCIDFSHYFIIFSFIFGTFLPKYYPKIHNAIFWSLSLYI